MGFRFVIGSICAGFLFGAYIGTMIIADQESLLSIERYVFHLKWGFYSAAIVGILACAIDALINLQSKEEFDWNKVREERYTKAELRKLPEAADRLGDVRMMLRKGK